MNDLLTQYEYALNIRTLKDNLPPNGNIMEVIKKIRKLIK
jgi:hypothetical protein